MLETTAPDLSCTILTNLVGALCSETVPWIRLAITASPLLFVATLWATVSESLPAINQIT